MKNLIASPAGAAQTETPLDPKAVLSLNILLNALAGHVRAQGTAARLRAEA